MQNFGKGIVKVKIHTCFIIWTRFVKNVMQNLAEGQIMCFYLSNVKFNTFNLSHSDVRR